MGKKIKFGITAPVPGESVEGLIKFAADAENAGFDTVWFPDHVVFMAKRLTPEVWSVITAASMKTSSVVMGTVGDSHRMHPAVFAHRLATVDHVSNGRIFVCVGYGEKMNLDPYGIKWSKPLTRVVESIKIMRALWKGEPVDFDGEIYGMSQAELRIQPVATEPHPDIRRGDRPARAKGSRRVRRRLGYERHAAVPFRPKAGNGSRRRGGA